MNVFNAKDDILNDINFDEKIDLSKLHGDIGLSTQTLKDLSSIELNGANVKIAQQI